MTEYEMAYLLNDMWINLISQTQFFFTILTTFLIASYIAAHRLTRSMTGVVVGLFLFACVGSCVNILRQTQTIIGLGNEMRAFALAGKGLGWHAVTKVPEWALQMNGLPGVAMSVLATVAAVYFFFHCRRVNRIAETGTASKSDSSRSSPTAGGEGITIA